MAILIIPILAALIIPVIMAQTVQARPQPNFFTQLGNEADAGKAAGIAAFKAGLSDTCSGGMIYCHEFHAGYQEAADVAP
jgi:hypothetical protein